MIDYLPLLSIPLISLISLVIFFIVLIKLFKHEGILKGILGLICGLYTFIWGWIKHKELQITKMMMLWSILTILSFLVPMVVGTAQVAKLIPMLQEQALSITGPKKGHKFISQKKKTTAKAEKKNSQAVQKQADWNSRAVALWKNGRYTNPNKAVEYLNRAINKKPDFAEAYNNRGNAYRDLNKHQKAVADYNKAIGLKSDYAQAYNNRGNVYFDLKKYQLAINDYNKSLSLKPSYRFAYLNRGLAYHQLKRNGLACKDLKRACQLGDCDGINWAKKNRICK
jgi:regulator of sirC expression with transglutaminase-like and TPR domain